MAKISPGSRRAPAAREYRRLSLRVDSPAAAKAVRVARILTGEVTASRALLRLPALALSWRAAALRAEAAALHERQP